MGINKSLEKTKQQILEKESTIDEKVLLRLPSEWLELNAKNEPMSKHKATTFKIAFTVWIIQQNFLHKTTWLHLLLLQLIGKPSFVFPLRDWWLKGCWLGSPHVFSSIITVFIWEWSFNFWLPKKLLLWDDISLYWEKLKMNKAATVSKQSVTYSQQNRTF